MSWINLLGYAASLSVLVTFCMNTMLPLRIVALASNVLFGVYGAVGHIYPVMILHIILFPINAARLVQIVRLMRAAGGSQQGGFSMAQLIPVMTRREMQAGAVVVRKGESADRMYYLAEGSIELLELGTTLAAPCVVGEIGLFAPDRRRTLTVTAKTDCVLYELRESQVKQLYFQNPAFAYAVIQLVVRRLLADPRAAATDPVPETA